MKVLIRIGMISNLPIRQPNNKGLFMRVRALFVCELCGPIPGTKYDIIDQEFTSMESVKDSTIFKVLQEQRTTHKCNPKQSRDIEGFPTYIKQMGFIHCIGVEEVRS
jgi:hypothetical protein